MSDSIDRHKAEWDSLPLIAGVPIPATHDGENAALYDLLESILLRVELIGEFDPAFALGWVESELAQPDEDVIGKVLNDKWSWRGKAA